MARTTDKRERILEYITQFTRENGYSPSVREICEGVGLASTATVHYHLNALRQEGSINMDGKRTGPSACQTGFRSENSGRRRGHCGRADSGG